MYFQSYLKKFMSITDADALSQSTEAGNVQSTVQHSNEIQSSSPNCPPNESVVQGSSVVKCLFNQPSFSIPTNSSGPKTPPVQIPVKATSLRLLMRFPLLLIAVTTILHKTLVLLAAL